MKHIFQIVFAFVICSGLFSYGQPLTNASPAQVIVKPPGNKENFHIYLLMGQSNMQGRDTRTLDSQVTSPHVLALENGKWVIARDPIFPPRGRTKPGIGPGIPFALEILKGQTNVTIGLVPCAVGGTSLRHWVKDGDLYERALKMAKVAEQSGVIKGVLWHQGESDTTSRKNAETYETRLTQMFKDLHHDLRQPNLPIVVGQLGYFLPPKKFPYANTVRAAIKHIPAVMKNVGYADSNGLVDRGDKLHFSAASAKKLGFRFAQAMQQLEN